MLACANIGALQRSSTPNNLLKSGMANSFAKPFSSSFAKQKNRQIYLDLMNPKGKPSKYKSSIEAGGDSEYSSDNDQ